VTAPALKVLRIGRTPYDDALTLQRAIHAERKAGRVADTLILTEHEPVLTLGRNAGEGNILAAPERLAASGIEVVRVERGGDVTYHGPGQLVAYPVLDLSGYARDVRRYVRALEETAIRLLGLYGVEGGRQPGTPGVWADGGKIASVGVFISRWVTMHGIAINIDPDLSHFDLIVPCGLSGMRMTSLLAESGRAISMGEAEEQYLSVFRAVFAELTPSLALQSR
jgi:lipoate-protein ligase B